MLDKTRYIEVENHGRAVASVVDDAREFGEKHLAEVAELSAEEAGEELTCRWWRHIHANTSGASGITIVVCE